MGEIVFVDSLNIKNSGEWSHLPLTVKESIHRQKDSIPYVVITSPDMKKSYGIWTHKELKYQDFSGSFREAKKEIRQDKKDGKLAISGIEKTTDEPTAEKEEPESKIVTFDNAELALWESTKGSSISAKLISIENDSIFVFETDKGKTIRVTEDQLAPSSLKKARKQAEDTINNTSALPNN